MKRYTPRRIPLLIISVCCALIFLLPLVVEVRRTGALNPAAPLEDEPDEKLVVDVLTKGNWTGGVIPMKDVPVHISVLPDGRLLYWARDKADVINNNSGQLQADGIPDWDETDKSKSYLWDPLYADFGSSPPASFTLNNTTTNLFCSGHSFLQDGSLLVSGGHRRHTDLAKLSWEGIGDEDLNVFDYRNDTWSLLRDSSSQIVKMPLGRWYPYNLTLPNGETIIISGSYLPSNPNQAPRLNRTPDIIGLDGVRRSSFIDNSLLDSNSFAIYPHIFVAPNGKVFYADSLNDSFSRFLDPSLGWAAAGTSAAPHATGSAVMYAPGQVMLAAGRGIINDTANQAVPFVQTINLNSPAWQTAANLTHPRMHSMLTLLPDGQVLALGGTRCPGTNEVEYNIAGEDPGSAPCNQGQVRTPELWNPTGGTWTQMANHQETRVYHSTSILLPDARVLVAGSGLPLAGGETGSGLFCYGDTARGDFRCRNNGHKTAEIFEPPYLFESDGAGAARAAVRPSIVAAPESLTYGQSFDVQVGNVAAADINKVVLVRLPSVTHGFDQDQRRVEMVSLVSGEKTLTVSAPVDGKACPPGPYMMFLFRNNQSKTPSQAKIVRVGSLSVSPKFNILWNGFSKIHVPANVEVKAQSGVAWQAVVSPAEASSWLFLDRSSGTGNGTISLTANVNSTGATRIATITIKIPGQNFTSQESTIYQSADFTDTASHPTQSSINKITGYGIASGCGGGNFCPDLAVTRSAMAFSLMKSMGVPESRLPAPNAPRYGDVGTGHALFRYVEGAARRGLDDGGCGSGNFCPNTNITRAQAAMLIIRSIGITSPPAAGKPHFTDVPSTHPAYLFIEELARRGVTGCSPGHFCPDAPLTKSQMAQFFVAAMGL